MTYEEATATLVSNAARVVPRARRRWSCHPWYDEIRYLCPYCGRAHWALHANDSAPWNDPDDSPHYACGGRFVVFTSQQQTLL